MAFDHDKKKIHEACGISDIRAEHIHDLILPVLRSSKSKSQTIEGLVALPGLNEVERTYCVFMAALQTSGPGSDIMGSFLKFMLSKAEKDGLIEKIGEGIIRTEVPGDDDDNEEQVDNLDLFN